MKKIKQLKIGPYKIKIRYLKTVVHEGQEVLGLFNMLDNTVYIAETAGGVNISLEVQTQTFFHECTHLILHILNEHELNQNEKFVDTLAYFVYNLHTQIITKEKSNGGVDRIQREIPNKLGRKGSKKSGKRSER